MGRFFRFRVLVDAKTERRGETASKGGFPSAGANPFAESVPVRAASPIGEG
jgi:hypothetical protein